jgi:heat shock protein HslJ
LVTGTLLIAAGTALGGCLGSDDATGQRPGDLVGRSFRSTGVTDSGEQRPLVSDTEITMSVSADAPQELNWSAGCNSFGADVEVTADRLLVGRVGGTLMGCPGALGVQEAMVAALFKADPRWKLTGDELLVTSGDTGIRFAAEEESTETATTPAKRVQSVRRSPRGLERGKPSAREVALAERIMAANAYLSRIVADGGGQQILKTGIVNAARPGRMLGVIVDLRLEQTVDGIYELPVVCHGVAGPPVALPSTPFNLSEVSRLVLMVTLADRRVASIEPHKGRWQQEPGAAYLSAPSTCEQRGIQPGTSAR